MLKPATALHLIKTVHTVVWALLACAVIAIPALAWQEQWSIAAVLIGIVLVECLVLVMNRMRCPLTDLAARYTEDRRDNFDIYLPLWLARYNKLIFGSLFGIGVVLTAIKWWT